MSPYTDAGGSRHHSADAPATASDDRAMRDPTVAADPDGGAAPPFPLQMGPLIDGLTDGFIVARSDGRLLQMNPAALRMLGFDRMPIDDARIEALHASIDCLELDGTPVPPDARPLPRALAGETFTDRRLIVVRPALGLRFVGSFSGAPVREPGPGGRLAAVVIRDVSDEHRKSLRLRRKERQLRGLIDALSIFVGLATPGGKLIELNAPAQLRGMLDHQAVIGRPLADLPWWSEDDAARETVTRAVADAAGGTPVRCDLVTRFEGETLHLDFMLAPLFGTNGRLRYLVASAVDIGDRVRAETRLREALERQELLVKEMNHRVKNSLQLISTLVRMRLPQVTDEGLRAVLDETAGRIQTVAALHGRLYQQTDVGTVTMRPLLETLTADIASGLADPATVALEAEDLRIATDQAMPLALIANELLISAVKHAAADPAAPGGITLRLAPADEGRWRLSVTDRGPGLGAAVRAGLGSRLVPALVRQIDGDMSEHDAGPGCEVAVGFTPASP